MYSEGGMPKSAKHGGEGAGGISLLAHRDLLGAALQEGLGSSILLSRTLPDVDPFVLISMRIGPAPVRDPPALEISEQPEQTRGVASPTSKAHVGHATSDSTALKVEDLCSAVQ